MLANSGTVWVLQAIWLEANPQISVVSFDDLSYPKAMACSEYLQKKYPGVPPA